MVKKGGRRAAQSDDDNNDDLFLGKRAAAAASKLTLNFCSFSPLWSTRWQFGSGVTTATANSVPETVAAAALASCLPT